MTRARGDSGKTRTRDEARAGEAFVRQPHLFLVLESQAPAAPAARWCLAAIDEVRVGRGDGRSTRFSWDAGRRLLDVRVADPWMSSAHARFVKDGDAWILEDAGSKNGSRLNGGVARRETLADGDLAELGSTFFVFRPFLRSRAEDPPELDGARLAPPLPGFATLLPSLALDLERLAQVARSGVSVVLGGETGTGKEVAARAIHALSGRGGPFVAVNCAAIPANLVESELFGHRAGSFSGATQDRVGLVRSADGGTLFLDEIGDLAPAGQAALLRVLQEREVLPVGATKPIRVDLRVLAATHRDLPAEVAAGRFRADLLARLAGFELTLPPLRDRLEDLGLLCAAILRAQGRRATFDSPAAFALLRHHWPHNVRELEQTLAAAGVLATNRPITLADLPAALRTPSARPAKAKVAAPPAAPALTAEDTERRTLLIDLLRTHEGSVSAVARALGKDRKQVQRWLKRYAIDATAFHK